MAYTSKLKSIIFFTLLQPAEYAKIGQYDSNQAISPQFHVLP